MRRYLSLSKSNNPLGSPRVDSTIGSEKSPLVNGEDDFSVTSATYLPDPTLKVKRVDHFYSFWSKKWKYVNSGSNVIPELRTVPSNGKDDPWQQYCFVVVREIPREAGKDPHFKIIVKSPYLLKICKEVVGEIAGISWNANPLEIDPQLLLAFLPNFQTYKDEFKTKAKISEEGRHLLSTVDILLEYFRKDYRVTLASIKNLTFHGEITFDLLFSILVPRSVMLSRHPATGELQALQLVAASVMTVQSTRFYSLLCESIDVNDTDTSTVASSKFCRVQSRIIIPVFFGTVKITSLDAYPIQYHPREAEIRRTLISRGEKWAGFCGGAGIHHMHYKGTGAFKVSHDNVIKYNVDSRVMIDRANFRRLNPNYAFPTRKPETVLQNPGDPRWGGEGQPGGTRHPHHDPHIDVPVGNIQHKSVRETEDLTKDELLLTSPIVWGFSLSDKLWLEFSVEKIALVEWNEMAFSNLILPADRKTLLQSLVEAHNMEVGFDDFIKGKGRGLVVNLFGPPGVGKTLSAEATSEHVKRPLYVVGSGDLGTTAAELDQQLQRVFELATAWKAVVLIDEADVFLEQRSLHDLERNAMVAIFLRHLEYYPSILFLTTNRVKTYDEAFLSRIHIALHFHSLSVAAREQVWTAFLDKAGVKVKADGGISGMELKLLTERDINGRQVKNATKTAQSLAQSRGEVLQYQHLVEVLDVMQQFSADFEKMKNQEI